jgi:hypothetical protein
LGKTLINILSGEKVEGYPDRYITDHKKKFHLCGSELRTDIVVSVIAVYGAIKKYCS